MRWWQVCLLAMLPALAACPSTPAPTPGVSACAAFCDVAASLDCPEGEPSPGGVPCVDWCENYHARGYLKPFSECGAASTNVEQIRACGVVCDASKDD